ncbi:MAG: hypothetical protein M1816_004918 [Peltula sp. TS41687]|nr:MAG: hypothetical protein M1816_004918 [Peltula sp. TS41687]
MAIVRSWISQLVVSDQNGLELALQQARSKEGSSASRTDICPGPDDFQCCLAHDTAPSDGPFPAPTILSVGACKQRAVDCAEMVVAAFPGKVRTEVGRAIAEWVMKNRSELQLKYVIRGQKIWNPSTDEVKSWLQWRQMEDRGSTTQNHWLFCFPQTTLLV